MAILSVEVSEALLEAAGQSARGGDRSVEEQVAIFARIGAAMTDSWDGDGHELSYLLGVSTEDHGFEDPHMHMVHYEAERQVIAEQIGALVNAIDDEPDVERKQEMRGEIRGLYESAHQLRVGAIYSRWDDGIEGVAG